MKCETPRCGKEFEPGKGGLKGPPARCPKCVMRERRGVPLDQREAAPKGFGTSFSLRCSEDEKSRWEKAAKKEKKGFREWVRETLDRKAGV